MAKTIVFCTHSTSVDNELGIQSGWLTPPLTEKGVQQAHSLGTQLSLMVQCDGRTWDQALEQDWRWQGQWQPCWRYSFPGKNPIG